MRRLEITVEGIEQNPGCRALLSDDGETQNIPACMGGLSIIGCNNGSVCAALVAERGSEDGVEYMIDVNDDDTIGGISTKELILSSDGSYTARWTFRG